METPELTRTWVASRTSARDATRTFYGWVLRRPRFWTIVLLLWVLLSLLLALTFEGDPSTTTRAIFGPALGLVAMVPVVAGVFALQYRMTVRRMGLRLAEGTVLESGFGADAVRVRGPLSDNVLIREGIDSVKVVGSWVLIRQRGVPLVGLWPAALFPPEELERLRGPASPARQEP